MAGATGRREASKHATRVALRSAAKQLFASQGYERTTIRDIARAAEVTERTFYRYFDSKDDLVADEFRSWLSVLGDAIRSRPAGESPLVAVRNGMLSVVRQAAASAPDSLWLVSSNPPVANLRRSAPRPLLRLEDAVTAAILARPEAGPGTGDGTAGADDEFAVRVIARISVAALRSAIIEVREQLSARQANPGGPSAAIDIEALLARAFATIGAAAGELDAGSGPATRAGKLAPAPR
jgi:AcrR family transcriptional regulator